MPKFSSSTLWIVSPSIFTNPVSVKRLIGVTIFKSNAPAIVIILKTEPGSKESEIAEFLNTDKSCALEYSLGSKYG